MAAAIQSLDNEQVVAFRLGEESYCIDIFRVNEIIRFREITPIPGATPYIRGLINLRGKTIPVVDLCMRLGIPNPNETQTSRIIVVESESGNVGLIVDAVREVLSLGADQIDPTPQVVNEIDADFVKGIVKEGGQLITFLNLDAVIAE